MIFWLFCDPIKKLRNNKQIYTIVFLKVLQKMTHLALKPILLNVI
ncbi:MAG: hypothetical protein BAJALOKI2v1_130057 [Promethearchaeota archaeon]|nr:MAG: hypothetical protein BAJALOKI2v1_130057 [Candidatus Lokiarchaeota archaeon]